MFILPPFWYVDITLATAGALYLLAVFDTLNVFHNFTFILFKHITIIAIGSYYFEDNVELL